MLRLALALASLIAITLFPVDALAQTCSQGRSGCNNTGGNATICQQRYLSCMNTGCWLGSLVKKCGYQKK